MNGLSEMRQRVAAVKQPKPTEVLGLVAVLLPRVEPRLGVRLVPQAQTQLPPEDWAWLASPELQSGPVADALLALIPQATGEPRVELICTLARVAPLEARRWAFEQFLTQSYPLESDAHGKVVSRHWLLATLLTASPSEWGEEWIATEPFGRDRELVTRNQFQIWSADAVDRVWTAHWGTRRQSELKTMLAVLSPERRRLLANATRQLTGWQRVEGLSWFSDELTEAEVDEVVSTPWQAVSQPRRANEPSVISQHLSFIPHRALARATPARLGAWLERVIAMRDAYHQGLALAALLPHLHGTPHAQAEALLRGLRAKDKLGVADADVVAHLTDAELGPWAELIAAKPGYRSSGIFERAQKGPKGLLEAVLQPFFAQALAAKDARCLALTALVLPAVHPLAPDWADALATQLLNR